MPARTSTGAPLIESYTWDFGNGQQPVQTTAPFVLFTYPAVPNGSASQQLLVTVTAKAVLPDTRNGYGSVLVTVTR